MNSPDTQTTVALSRAEILTLNTAQEILNRVAADCFRLAWTTPNGFNEGNASSADFARTGERATVACDAIFDVKNVGNVHGVLPLTEDDVMSRRDSDAS